MEIPVGSAAARLLLRKLGQAGTTASTLLPENKAGKMATKPKAFKLTQMPL